ncbi:MAG: integrase core domain-containing protein [Snodgrassella sp.]|nr:integrase core domain-containing protein [Snodgrassella sp.]
MNALIPLTDVNIKEQVNINWLKRVITIVSIQKFTKPACPQTNGKAERVIRTLIKMRHNQQIFSDSKDRQQKLKRLIKYNNTSKPHKAILGKTPYEF